MVLLVTSLFVGERKRVKTGSGARAAAAILLMLGISPELAAKNAGVEAYERGDYKSALEQFSQQLKKRPDSSELHFNLGSAAYQEKAYDKALESFAKAVTSPDPKLRAAAEYNLANTLYQRGAAQKEKAPKLQEWKNALQHYEEALKTQPENGDAKHNRDLVRRLMEELQKEPPKSDQEKKQDQEKKDQEKKDEEKKDGQQDKKDQQGDDQQQKSEENKDGEKQDQKDKSGKGDQQDPQKQDGKDGEPKDEQEKQGGDKSDPQEQKEGEGKDQKDGEGKDQKEGDATPEPMPGRDEQKKEGELKSAQGEMSPQEAKEAEQAAEAAAAAEGRMTQMQAKALLESLRSEDEHVQLLDPSQRKSPPGRMRDW
jgi:Ca-activated chloride channel family protein